MSPAIPLIRAGALLPLLRWAEANGRPTDAWLMEADLTYFAHHDPEFAIPLLPVVTCLRNASRTEGPDIGCRIVPRTSAQDPAMLGRPALGTRTPQRAMAYVSAAFPLHCTHESIAIRVTSASTLLRHTWSVPLGDEILHVTQQYVAALLLALCRGAGAPNPTFERVSLVSHSERGLSHLRPWFGTALAPSRDGSLEIVIPNRIAERALRASWFDRLAPEISPTAAFGADGRLATSAAIVISAMLRESVPTAERLARAAGLSLRTLQRRLADEGTTFSQLLDNVRRDQALAEFSTGRWSVGDISFALGYGGQAALTRAVRRWTGALPRSLHRRPRSDR